MESLETSSTQQKGRIRQFAALFWDAITGKSIDLTSASLSKSIWFLAIPMILEWSMESVFALVDIFFVGRLGQEAIAVVGFTETMITILYAVAIGLSMTVTGVVARRVGEGNVDQANVVGMQAIIIGVVLSAVIAVFGSIYAPDLLWLIGAEPEVIEQGSSYTRILYGGSTTIFLLFLINGVFRGAGDASLAMRSLWIANGANIILDPLLIFGIGPFPEMGVAGAAVATTIGRSLGVGYQLYALLRGSGLIRITRKSLVVVPQVIKKLLKLSIGGIGQFIVGTTSWVFLAWIVGFGGTTAMAGYQVGLRIIFFTFLRRELKDAMLAELGRKVRRN